MRSIFVLLFLCLVMNQDLQARPIRVQVTITDVDTVMMLVRGADWTDTLHTTNGQFNKTIQLAHPQLVYLILVKHPQSIQAILEENERGLRSIEDVVSRNFFVDSGNIRLTGNFATLETTTLEHDGPDLQAEWREFRKRFDPLVRMARTIIDSSFTVNKDSVALKVFNMLYKRVLEIEKDVAIQFAKDYANSYVGAYVLYWYGRSEDVVQLEAAYQRFPDSIQRSYYLSSIRDKIKALKALQPGQPAPVFTLDTHDGKSFSLSSLKGRYVVLDFWGSWCQPCIAGVPSMKTYQERYQDKLSFVGIACNDTPEAWRLAILTHGMNWVQVLDAGGEQGLAKQYNVEAFPTKILLDPEGRFLKAFIGEGQDFYTELDKLFRE